MQRRRSTRSHHRPRAAAAAFLLAMLAVIVPGQTAIALIMGGKGNQTLADPGWPKGAAAIFNHAARIAWWEGPPFGGGQWHAECRGDAQAFSAVLADFARLEVTTKRVIVHDGVGRSFWLNPNHEPAKQADARMDWVLMVWVPANWERLRNLPADLNPTDRRDAGTGPPAQIDVYAGGDLRWSDVVVPDGVEVIDQRLDAHGFTPADGIVLEGKVIDLATKRPVAAQMRLQLVEPQPTGGYRYSDVAEAAADEAGRWVLKKTPPGWHRVVVEAEGFVPMVAGYAQFDEQPRWFSYDCGLARGASVTGRVADETGQPLAEADVRLADVVSESGERYKSPQEYRAQTDADGRFHIEQVPVGSARIWINKTGYCRSGRGPTLTVPAKGIEVTMMKAAAVQVTVDFAGTDRPSEYVVDLEPEGGDAVGKWSGSGKIDAKNQISFKNIPPGRYVLRGQPNPSTADERTQPQTIDLLGGQAVEITLPIK